MGRYALEVKVLQPVADGQVREEALVTLAEAAEMLGIAPSSVNGAVNRGALGPVYVDLDAANPNRERRLLLRSEVSKYGDRRKRRQRGGPRG